MEQIQVRMLGEFSLQAGDQVISDTNNRTRKVWSVLAYLIYHRGKVISQKKLISMFWGDERSTNPDNVVRITFHRIRSQLDKLWEGAGKELIVNKDAGYIWNDQADIRVDVECFDALCSQKAQSPAERIARLEEALAMYGGDFLEKQSSDIWVIPVSTHFHNMYVGAAMEAARLLMDSGEHEKAIGICQKAIRSEPYHEELHQMLIRHLAAAEDKEGASQVYESLRKRLFDDFGIQPSEETKAVFRNAVRAPGEQLLSIDAVMQQLYEKEAKPGALLCDYDCFKVLCYVESRDMERYGNISHVALISVGSRDGQSLSRRSTQRIMEQLGDQIGTNLRRGDVYSRCSIHQYIILLYGANYENSCMVCRRLLGAFKRAHPHVTAQINYMVQPLGPGIHMP